MNNLILVIKSFFKINNHEAHVLVIYENVKYSDDLFTVREREDAEDTEDFSQRESVELILYSLGMDGSMTDFYLELILTNYKHIIHDITDYKR